MRKKKQDKVSSESKQQGKSAKTSKSKRPSSSVTSSANKLTRGFVSSFGSFIGGTTKGLFTKLFHKKPQKSPHQIRRERIVRFITAALIATLLIRVDLSTKLVIFKYLPLEEDGIPLQYDEDSRYRAIVFPGLAFVNVKNKGIAWGSFQNNPHGKLIFITIGIILETILLFYYFVSKNRQQRIATILIFSGGFGNIFDRFQLGYVRDFIDIYFYDHHWPAFNLADAFVITGALILIAQDFMAQSKERKKRAQKSASKTKA